MKDRRTTTYVTYRCLPDGGFELVERHAELVPKDRPITVKGNSRQEVVQGKRHSWPVSQKRKGHR